VGGYFGGRLLQAGEDVMFTARGAHREAIRSGGLRVVSAEGTITVPPARCADTPADIGPVDVVLFCVKSYDTESTASGLAPLLRPDTVIISLQNGVDNEDRIAACIPAGMVFGGVAYIYSTITRPGEITETGGPKKIVFGPFAGAPASHRERAAGILEAMRTAGIHAEIPPDMTVALWKKFIFITGAAGITALTRLTLGEILAVDAARDLLLEAMTETNAVARARGIPVEDEFLHGVFATLRRFDNATRSSLYNDLVHGKPLEIEALSGTVVRLGAGAGVATPVNRTVYAALLPFHLKHLQAHPR
jgi:2-dehydropantoate 2-reductase